MQNDDHGDQAKKTPSERREETDRAFAAIMEEERRCALRRTFVSGRSGSPLRKADVCDLLVKRTILADHPHSRQSQRQSGFKWRAKIG